VLVGVATLPVVFMWIGARCLERRTSAGLAMTGAVFAILVGVGMGLIGLIALASIFMGNFGAVVGAPLLLLGSAANIQAAVLTFSAVSQPGAREAFGRR